MMKKVLNGSRVRVSWSVDVMSGQAGRDGMYRKDRCRRQGGCRVFQKVSLATNQQSVLETRRPPIAQPWRNSREDRGLGCSGRDVGNILWVVSLYRHFILETWMLGSFWSLFWD